MRIGMASSLTTKAVGSRDASSGLALYSSRHGLLVRMCGDPCCLQASSKSHSSQVQPLRRWANTLGQDSAKFCYRGIVQNDDLRSSQAGTAAPQVMLWCTSCDIALAKTSELSMEAFSRSVE